MGMACWHDNRFSFVQQIFNAINRDFSDTIQAGDEGVPTRFMGADLFALCE
jgi:hypothetical protein